MGVYVAWGGATLLLGPAGFWLGAVAIGASAYWGVNQLAFNWDRYDTAARWRVAGNVVGGALAFRPGQFAAHRLTARVKFARDVAYSGRFEVWARNAPPEGPAGYPAPPKSRLSRHAEYWFERHGLEMLYRGDRPILPREGFLSSVARGKVKFRGKTGIEASRQLAAELESVGFDPRVMRAKFHDEYINSPHLSPFPGEPIGGAGIPFSEFLPVAAGYARRGNVYGVVLPKGAAPRTIGHLDLWWEFERVALHHVPRRHVMGAVPGTRIPHFIPPPQ